MLVRPCGDGIEVLMLRRSSESHFAPEAYVFPGGTVDEEDGSQQTLARTYGIDEQTLEKQFRARGLTADSASLAPPAAQRSSIVVAALRELFEEAGVLLACDAAGRRCGAEDQPEPALLERARADLAAGRTRFARMLAGLNLFADARALVLFSHWVTPPTFARRYNTHFFVASARADQAARADALETHDGIWIAPRQALRRWEEGTFTMVFPTIKHMERLAEFRSPEELIAFAQSKTIYSIMPEVPAQREFLLPAGLESSW